MVPVRMAAVLATLLVSLFSVFNISWTTVTEPALAASPAADQLQIRQTLLPGYLFPTE